MSGVCYKAGQERAAWYELKCLRHTIASKEAGGIPATFERELYKAWLKNPDYAKADKENRANGFYGDLSSIRDKRDVVSKIITDISDTSANFETSKEVVLSHTASLQTPNNGNKRGRPLKSGDISRTTAWRREKQGVLV